MKATMTLHRVYFFVVFWFTCWVGYIGFFRPLEILRALPWPAPPLHARFIGALYLGASAFLLLAMLGRSRLQVRTVVDIALVWTGWLLVITIMHWGMFDFAREQVWFWVVAYIAFPIVAAWLAWASPATTVPRNTLMAQPWVPIYLRLQGAALVAMAALLMVLPGWVAGLWPWKISTFLAQVYSGPVLGFGVGSLLLAARRNWPETLIPTTGMLVFAVLALIGSSWHLGLFTAGSPSQFIWFGSLAFLAIMSVVLIIGALRSARGMRTSTHSLEKRT